MPTQPATIDRPRYTGSITFDEAYPIPNVDRGVVTIIGSPARAKVTIWSFDDVADHQRGEQVDIMRNVEVAEDGDVLILTGESARLLHEQKRRDNTVTVRLTRNGKCAGCGYS